jgi:sugar phosphate isomerase/epimerase
VAEFARAFGVEVAALQPPLNLPDRPGPELFDNTVASLRELTDAAAGLGLTLAIECHARSVFETLEASRRLVREAPEVSVAYDPSHFVMAGVETAETLDLLERAAHVHLRDAAPGQMQVPMGEGQVDFDRIFGKLKDIDYRGAISVECLEREERSVAEDIRRLKRRIEAAFA